MTNLPVPSPRTFTVNETETAAYLNSIRDALLFLLNKPEGQFTQSAVQSLANNAWQSLTLDATVVDTYGGHSNVTNNSRYTAQVAGWYLCSGAVSFAGNGTNIRGVRLMKNGVTPVTGSANARANGGGGFDAMPTPAIEVFLNVGDYVEVQAFQNTGSALNTSVASDLDSMLSVLWAHT